MAENTTLLNPTNFVKFNKGSIANLPTSGAKENEFYLANDARRLYIGIADGKTALLNSSINIFDTVTQFSDLTGKPDYKPIEGDMAFIKSQTKTVDGSTTTETINALVMYFGGSWQQINTPFNPAGLQEAIRLAQQAAEDADGKAQLAQNAASLAQQQAAAADAKAVAAAEAAEAAQATIDGQLTVIAGKLDASTYEEDQDELDERITGIENNAKLLATTSALNAAVETINENMNKKADAEQVGKDIAAAKQELNKTITDGLDEKADKTSTENSIRLINEKLGTLGTVMNFVGELEGTTDEDGNITITGVKDKSGTPADGDVGYYGSFEYVYNKGTWEKFGDTTAESARISALEAIVGDTSTEGTLTSNLADLRDEYDTFIDETWTSHVNGMDLTINGINGRLDLAATKEELNGAVSDINGTISALDEAYKEADEAEKDARELAITTLANEINLALSWGSFPTTGQN